MEKEQPNAISLPTLEQVERERNKLKYQKEYRRTILHIIGILIVAAAVSVLLATMFFPIIQVSGVSMEPTLEDEQIILLEKTGKFKTGDLIGFYYQNKILLKRVIGRAGECDITLPYQVPDGKIFVMGDHRSKSIDSRSKLVGCVSEEQVIGRVAFRLWPLQDIGFLK